MSLKLELDVRNEYYHIPIVKDGEQVVVRGRGSCCECRRSSWGGGGGGGVAAPRGQHTLRPLRAVSTVVARDRWAALLVVLGVPLHNSYVRIAKGDPVDPSKLRKERKENAEHMRKFLSAAYGPQRELVYTLFFYVLPPPNAPLYQPPPRTASRKRKASTPARRSDPEDVVPPTFSTVMGGAEWMHAQVRAALDMGNPSYAKATQFALDLVNDLPIHAPDTSSSCTCSTETDDGE